MNRLQSMLAAGLTTAISAAAVGAFASAQGLFDGGTSHASESTTNSAAQQLTQGELPDASASTPQVIYKDLEPIIVTRQVFTTAPEPQPASASGTSDDRGGDRDDDDWDEDDDHDDDDHEEDDHDDWDDDEDDDD